MRPLTGKVWLVGAGPGDPELLTRKAERLLREAKVIAYDELVSEEVLTLANPHAERIAVGRRANGCRHHDGVLHPLVLERAQAGLDVVRLKGGDPMIFGRGGEEADVLARAGVPFEFVPGVTAALGAAASTGIPLTHREVSRQVTLATAHPTGDPRAWASKLAASLPREGTVVLYMGMNALQHVARELVHAGRGAQTPVAVISHATLKTEQTVVGTLNDIAERVRDAQLPLPGLILVGEVVARQRRAVVRRAARRQRAAAEALVSL